MDFNNLNPSERERLFKQQGDDSNALIAKQLLEMKAATGYGYRLTSIASTYSSATNTINFPSGVHYITMYSDSDVDFVFNATDDTDAANKLNSPTTSTVTHFIASAERLSYGLPELPVRRIDFKSHSGTAIVYVTAFVKASNFDENDIH